MIKMTHLPIHYPFLCDPSKAIRSHQIFGPELQARIPQGAFAFDVSVGLRYIQIPIKNLLQEGFLIRIRPSSKVIESGWCGGEYNIFVGVGESVVFQAGDRYIGAFSNIKNLRRIN